MDRLHAVRTAAAADGTARAALPGANSSIGSSRPFSGRRAARHERQRSRQPVARLGRQQQPIAGLAGRRLHARGYVHHVADHAEVEAAGAPDRSRHHGSRVDPHAHAQLTRRALLGHAHDVQSGAESAVGVVAEHLRRAEHGEQAVADELVHMAAVASNGRHDRLEELVQARHDLGRVRPLGEPGEVAHVAEQHRDLGLERARDLALTEDVLRHVAVEVGPERLAQLLALSSPAAIRLNPSASSPSSSLVVTGTRTS